MIENTSKRDPALHLLGSLDGFSGYVTGMESAGQRQIVESTDLPTKGSDDPEFLSLGFTFGDPHSDDPLFRPATLPEGWKREGSDHAMWSYILDTLGRQRVAVFYKAAYYDRKAHMRIESVYSYVNTLLYEGGTPVLDDQWATAEAVIEAAQDYIGSERESVELYERPDVAAREGQYALDRIAEHKQRIAAAEAFIEKVRAT